LTTPLQLATATAMLANGGVRVEPRLVQAVRDPITHKWIAQAPAVREKMPLHPGNLDIVRQAMVDVLKPGGPPAAPAAPGQIAPPAATLKQQNIARLQADLAAIVGKGQVSTELKQRFAKDLLAGSQGLSKPSGATVARAADNLAGLLVSKSLESSEQARLAQDLNAICDCGNIGATRVEAILSDVQAILQVSGVKRSEAVSAVADLRAIASEIQRAPTR
jgi:hypothetical protein